MNLISKRWMSTAAGAVAVLFFAVCPVARADNWPAWRGPQGNGRCAEQELPLSWSETNNVCWKSPLPERGNSTPVIWGNHIFLTQAEGLRRSLWAFDRLSGRLLWKAGVDYPEKELTHETNPYCSSSPVTDGERVIAFFGSAGVFAYDFKGKELWRRDLGKQIHIWGSGGGLTLHRDLCLVNFGPGTRTFLAALNKKTGDKVWQHDEPGGDSGEQSKDWRGSWSTPLIFRGAGRTELIMNYPNRVAAFDPDKGTEIWTCGGLGPLSYTSPVADEGVVVAMSGYGGPALAVRAGGSGDVTESHRLWRTPKCPQRIGSAVIYQGHIYILDDPGTAECLDLKTGEKVWEEPLRGPAKGLSSWSSMVLAGPRLYVINKSGDTFVLEAAPKFKVLAVNPIGEPTLASLAPAQGHFYIRTHQNLWCIGPPFKAAGAGAP